MANQAPVSLRHLDFSGRANRRHYTAKGGGGGRFELVPRNRAAHAQKLRQELQVVQTEAARVRLTGELAAYEDAAGIDIEIRGVPGRPLKLESLDSPKLGIVLKNTRLELVPQAGADPLPIIVATVFVRDGKLSSFIDRVNAYAAAAKRDNMPLIANIESIALAAIGAYWTSKHPLPELDENVWWEVWIRAGATDAKRILHEGAALAAAQARNMEIRPGKLVLPEHTIFLIKTTRRTLSATIPLLNFVSELRHPALTAAHFVEQPAADQHALIQGLKNRLTLPANTSTAVCLLDTGVNRGHPLLADILHPDHHDTVKPEWGKDDHEQFGHGTQMAGLAAYGDLTPLLTSQVPVQLTHHLESVKILPRVGHNEPEHYGPITQQAMALAETNAPHRRRVFALAITATDATDFCENGRPSAWSAALDSYASGLLETDETKRLICVSVGNVPGLINRNEYPSFNELFAIEDPAQSWNALTIGAYTNKDTVLGEDGNLLGGWAPLATKGGLCPESRTSVLWSGKESRHWPLKPDVVFEGGNRGYDHSGFASTFDSLSVLSTNSSFQQRLLATFNATSAATALAAQAAATISARYPEHWPETTRALMVHSAEWTTPMRQGINPNDKATVSQALARFGFGVPDVARALASARSRATLIAQDSLQPFEKRESRVVTRDMMLYRLPWPKQLLQDQGESEVRLRVTLSYFVEPNPGARVPNTKYRYAGCNLRFQVQTPTESLNNFIARVTDAISAEEKAEYAAPDDTTEGWLVGDQLRRRGSIHCDTWTGSAAKLAQMEHIAVFPVNGWWKLRPQHNRFGKRIRYSLVMSLESLGADIDIYNPIQAAIALPIQV